MSNRFLRLNQVKNQTGLSLSTIYNKMNKGDFPKSIKLGERTVAWIELEIEEWINTKIAESRTPQ